MHTWKGFLWKLEIALVKYLEYNWFLINNRYYSSYHHYYFKKPLTQRGAQNHYCEIKSRMLYPLSQPVATIIIIIAKYIKQYK